MFDICRLQPQKELKKVYNLSYLLKYRKAVSFYILL